MRASPMERGWLDYLLPKPANHPRPSKTLKEKTKVRELVRVL
jgi:hypothetical protein